MADDKNNRGGMDRALIALGEASEVSYWSKKLKITPAKLKATREVLTLLADNLDRREAEVVADRASVG